MRKGWAEELPKLQHEGFKVEIPKLGPVLLVGYLPTGEHFAFTCAEKTCRLSLQFADGRSQEWEEEVVGLEGDQHARWMLPNEAVRVLRSMIKNRPPEGHRNSDHARDLPHSRIGPRIVGASCRTPAAMPKYRHVTETLPVPHGRNG